MRLETERLILRPFEERDLEALHACLSDGETMRFEPDEPMSPEETQEALRWRMSTDEMLAVERKEDGRLLGNVYLGKRPFDTLELGYLFHREHWGKGYASEACKAAVDASFRKGVHRICAECDPKNGRSWRLLERLGFEREAHLRQNVFFRRDEAGNPVWKDTYIYGKLNK